MDRHELEKLWSETLRSPAPNIEQFDRLAQGIVDTYASGDEPFRQHIKNRFDRVTKSTDQDFDAENFGFAMARTFIADEIGFSGWHKLVDSIENPSEHRPILFQYAIAAMWRGDFSALESMVGGREKFDDQVVEWYQNGFFEDEQETLAEIFSASCMLGYEKTAAYLLDNGVDPYAGMKTGLAGFHYAASSGRLGVIKLLIDRKVPMEVRNMYGGTVFEQSIWSTVNEYKPDHAAIVEALIDAGAIVEPGYSEWWEKQNVPSSETKKRVADALKRDGKT